MKAPPGTEEALKKIKHFCTYQERSHKEVRDRLYSYGLKSREVDEIIGHLIEHNFLSEQRFARQYAGGKFRMKNWGRKKIVFGLKQKGASEGIIKAALKEINEEDYYATLLKLASKKWDSLLAESLNKRQAKVKLYLMQKGYEPALIYKIVHELNT